MQRASLVNVRVLRVDGAPLGPGAPAAARVHGAAMRVLDGTPLGAWSTVGTDGSAHVNIGYFAHSDELHLYFLSHPGSLHCRNVAVNPTMAVAVFPSAQNWTDPGRGIQLFGRCAQVTDGQALVAERVYGARYGAYAGWKAALKAGDPALDYRFYRFIPDRMKLLDEAEFGDAVFVVAEIIRTR
jgi:uncharacterized protein YhbP (UPF0306 family)